MSEGTLKPCPFCGGDKARTIHIRDGRKVACICGACGKPQFNGPLDKPSADERAITAWNTRAEAISAEPVADLAGYERGQRETVARIVDMIRDSASWHDKHDDGLSGFDKISQGQVEIADAIEAGEWK